MVVHGELRFLNLLFAQSLLLQVIDRSHVLLPFSCLLLSHFLTKVRNLIRIHLLVGTFRRSVFCVRSTHQFSLKSLRFSFEPFHVPFAACELCF